MPRPNRSVPALPALVTLSLALALVSAPFHLDWKGIEAATAYAAKNGGPGGAGKSGDGRGKSGSAPGKDKAKDASADKAESGGISDADDGDDIAGSNELGSLNAAHASDTARAHASSNSTVGRIASYEAEIQEGDVDAAATSIDEAANKTVTDRVLHAVNELLGIDDNPVEGAVDPTTVHDLEDDVAQVAQR